MAFFEQLGYSEAMSLLLEEVQALYLSDETPWVIGYSGGKDSSAVTQLVWMALEGLPEDKRHKPVYVITTDTLVENPVVSAWVDNSLERMGELAKERNIPITPHLLKPDIENTFWVNLIGRGYPAPRRVEARVLRVHRLSNGERSRKSARNWHLTQIWRTHSYIRQLRNGRTMMYGFICSDSKILGGIAIRTFCRCTAAHQRITNVRS